MYLVVTPRSVRQFSEFTFSNNELSWIYDNNIEVYRFHEGSFQLRRVYYETNERNVMNWKYEWNNMITTAR